MSISYKYIEKGGFAFVISPNIINDTDKTYNLNTVSKIFIKYNKNDQDDEDNDIDNHDNVKTELENHKIINNLDPEYKYHLKILNDEKYFNIELKQLKKLNIEKLPNEVYKLLNKNNYYINYESGGLSLFDLFNKHNNIYTKNYYDKSIYIHICNEIFKLMNFIKLLLDNNFIHHDLNQNNILINNSLIFKVIDFGLMQYIPDYVIDCTYNKEELYVFFPLENEYYNSDNFKNCRKIADKKNFLSKFNYLKACYNKFFENYFTESFLIKYNEMIDIMQSKTHNDFLNTSFKTFDIYSLGITLIFITEKYVNHTINKRHRYEEDYIVDNSKSIYNSYYYEWIYSEKIQEIILKMITPNVFERITIDELLIEFNSYLVLLSS
jgi:hypothetical protein